MALNNIIPTAWLNTVLAALRKDLVFGDITNQNFKQSIWGLGDTLNILTMGAMSDEEYDASNITYADLTDAKAQLVIDKKRYVAFYDEDTNKALTNVKYLAEVLTDAGHQIADYFDALGMAEHVNASLNSYSTGTTSWQITKDKATNLPALMGAIRRQLKKAKAPAGDVFLIAPPEIEECITLYFGDKGPASPVSDAAVVNGHMGKYFGVQVYISNNCETGASITHGLAGVKGTAIAMAADVITDEGIRLEGRIATGHRMLGLGGVKTYRPEISIDVNLNEVVIATS